MKTKPKVTARFGAAALGLILAGCSAGGDGHGEMAGMEHGSMEMDGGGHGGGHEEFAFGAPGMASMAARTVTVTIADNLYDPASIAVKDGEAVRFVLVNKDDADHEFILGPAEMQAERRKEMMEMMDKGMVMEHAEANALPVPALATREMTWTFAGSGTIEYACNIPGHYESGMHGSLTIAH